MIELLYCLIELCTLFYLVHYLNGKRMKVDLVTVVFIFVNIAIVKLISAGILEEEIILATYVITFVYFKIHLHKPLAEILKTYLLSILCVAILQMGIGSVAYVLLGSLVGENVIVLVINSLVAIMAWCVTFAKEKGVLEYISKWTSRHKLLMLYIGACMVAGVLVFKLHGEIELVQMVGVFVFAITIMAVIVMWQRDKEKFEQEKVEIHKEEMYKNDYAEMIKEIRRKQHDFDNHLSAISGMYLTADSLEELVDKQEEYRRNIVVSNKYNKMANDKSSSVIIGFLYNKFMQAEARGIDVVQHIVIEQAECRLSQIELVTILGILIDNGIEAVAQENIVTKSIKVEMLEYNDKIVIEVGNPHKQVSRNEMAKYFEEGYSTKGENRGLGLYNVKKMVESVKGKILAENKVVNDLDWFAINIELNK